MPEQCGCEVKKDIVEKTFIEWDSVKVTSKRITSHEINIDDDGHITDRVTGETEIIQNPETKW